MLSFPYNINRVYLLLIFAISIFSYTSPFYASASTLQSVIKIKSYQSKTDGSYVFKSYGSAIAISSTRVLTNAHVILGTDGEPTFHYEICISTDFHMVPRCISSARLIALDTISDLALLEFSSIDALDPVIFSPLSPNIGDSVATYGYPQIGGDTITRTEGKIAGYDRMMYKIDGGIDHGNSWWGAFDNSGQLIGIPTAVASDNSSIGYIIPVSRIHDFLQGQTPGYIRTFPPRDMSFVRYLHRNESIAKETIYTFAGVYLKNPRSAWLVFKWWVVSTDGLMSYGEFSDPYERIHVLFSCTDDRWKLPTWQIRRDGIQQEIIDYPEWIIESSDMTDLFTVSMISSSGENTITLYYKKFPACFTEITTVDNERDRVLKDRVVWFFRKAILQHMLPWTEPTSQSPSGMRDDIRTIRSIDADGSLTRIMGIRLQDSTWIHGILREDHGIEQSLFNERVWLLRSDNWASYLKRIKDTTDQYQVVPLWPWQTAVLSRMYDTTKQTTHIAYQYLYHTTDWKYGYSIFDADVPGIRYIDLEFISKIFSQYLYTGVTWGMD